MSTPFFGTSKDCFDSPLISLSLFKPLRHFLPLMESSPFLQTHIDPGFDRSSDHACQCSLPNYILLFFLFRQMFFCVLNMDTGIHCVSCCAHLCNRRVFLFCPYTKQHDSCYPYLCNSCPF